jgi:UDP-2-acetamido-2-deoxy-ribo-hexuluronate aminotransferase
MAIPFIDLKAQHNLIKTQIQANMNKVLEHGAYVMGPEIIELEQNLARFCKQKYALACSSGTDALILSLLALGIKPGDGVLTTPFTFFATAEAIAFIGAVPVFVDIDPVTFNISPDHLSTAIRALKTTNRDMYPLPDSGKPSGLGHTTPDSLVPKAIISVDLFGLPCDYDRIETIARQENLKLIVDAAQSFGATYRQRATCSMGHVACTSFFPAKPLGCYGDGGMCFTSDPETYERLTSFRVHGQGQNRYDNIRLGMNARMDTLQAAVLLAKMDIFAQELILREKVAARYNLFFEQPGAGLSTPDLGDSNRSAWAQYSLLARDNDHRQAIFNKLEEHRIPWAVYYPLPLHLQKAFAYLGYQTTDFPVSEKTSERIFSLPMHPYLQKEDQQTIADVVLSA